MDYTPSSTDVTSWDEQKGIDERFAAWRKWEGKGEQAAGDQKITIPAHGVILLK